MKLGTLIKTIRTSQNVTQSELAKDIISRGKLADIEKNITPVNINEIVLLLKKLDFETEEIITILNSINKNISNYLQEELEYIYINKNKLPQNYLKNFEKKIDKEKYENFSSLNVYIVFKSMFSDNSNIEPLTKKEIEVITRKIKSRKIHSINEYKILANITRLVTLEEVETLYNILFPVKYNDYRGVNFNHVIIQIYNNILTQTIKHDLHGKTKFYLNEAQKNHSDIKNYFATLQLKYLKEISEFSQTGEISNLNKAHYYATVTKELDDLIHYGNIQKELQSIVTKTNKSTTDQFQVIRDLNYSNHKNLDNE